VHYIALGVLALYYWLLPIKKNSRGHVFNVVLYDRPQQDGEIAETSLLLQVLAEAVLSQIGV
jgi:hypothetical protein